jgi:hypothetical protein
MTADACDNGGGGDDDYYAVGTAMSSLSAKLKSRRDEHPHRYWAFIKEINHLNLLLSACESEMSHHLLRKRCLTSRLIFHAL